MNINGLPFVDPLEPKPAAKATDDPKTLNEMKYDGWRALGYLNGGKLPFMSKQDIPWRFKKLESELCDYFAALRIGRKPMENAIFDGEIVSFGPGNRPIRTRVPSRLTPKVYIAFDIMWLNGRDLRWLPLRERKKILEDIVPAPDSKGPLRQAFGIVGHGTELFDHMVKLDVEGIVAKRLDSFYAPSARWLKIKVHPDRD